MLFYIRSYLVFFRNLRDLLKARDRFHDLTKGGMDPDQAGDAIVEEFKGIDPERLAAIIAFIMQLIATFSKTA